MTTIVISIQDIVKNGSFTAAVWDQCTQLGIVCGAIGPSRSTQCDADVMDLIEKDDNPSQYVDVLTGFGAVISDSSDHPARVTQVLEWTETSVIQLICPTFEDAARHPQQFETMVKRLIYHRAKSDTKMWDSLINNIRFLCERIKGL